MTTYDPESQAERRRVGGLLQEPLQTEGWGAGAPNFNGGLARKPQSQNFGRFLNPSWRTPTAMIRGMGVTAESM